MRRTTFELRYSICLFGKKWRHIRRSLATCSLISSGEKHAPLVFLLSNKLIGVKCFRAFMLSLLAEGSYVWSHCVFSLERRNELSSFIPVWDWPNKLFVETSTTIDSADAMISSVHSEIIKLAVNKEFFIKARRPHCEMYTVFPQNEFVGNVKWCWELIV